jgi:hypothetical protein
LRDKLGVELLTMLGLELYRLAGAEDVIREIGRGLDAARAAASLNEHWPALWRRHAAQWTFDLKERAGMVDRLYLLRIGNHDPGLAIPDEGVRRDARPKRFADMDEFLHPFVTQIMLHQLVEAVIGGVGAPGGGNDVEGNTSTGEVIERIQQPRDIERMHEGRRIGDAEADMLCQLAQRRDVAAHILSRPADAPANGFFRRAAPGRRNAGTVAEEQHVDETAFGDARDLLEDGEIRIDRAGPRARQLPAALEMRPGQVESEMHFRLHAQAPRQSSSKLPTWPISRSTTWRLVSNTRTSS